MALCSSIIATAADSHGNSTASDINRMQGHRFITAANITLAHVARQTFFSLDFRRVRQAYSRRRTDTREERCVCASTLDAPYGSSLHPVTLSNSLPAPASL